MSVPPPRRPFRRRLVPWVLVCGAAFGATAPPPLAPVARSRPDILLVTVDTLRADYLSSYGFDRATTPRLDALMARGVRFAEARTVEPLTAPALTSMLTSVEAQDHGAPRNGLRMRVGLASLPKTLQAHGYDTAAIVSNWTLRHKLTGLADHFEAYEELLTRKRWLGLSNGESDGDDVTDAAIERLDAHLDSGSARPFFLWVHYTDPHAPYVAHPEYRARLGLPPKGDLSREERYATEVAFVDAAIGRLLDHLAGRGRAAGTMIVVAADHGESLGEHGYWGHGRNLYEPGLRIPMAVIWPGHVAPRVVRAPALNLDIAPTILGLAGLPAPPSFRGFDWTATLAGGAPPVDRVTRYQAHKGAVLSKHDSDLARRSGLLEVGILQRGIKEIYHVRDQRRERYDLTADPGERVSDVGPKAAPSESVLAWIRTVYGGLATLDDDRLEPLDDESSARLRSLGYAD